MKTSRDCIYAFLTPYNTCYVVNYSGKSEVNTFLHWFDVWGSWGHHTLCEDGEHSKFAFECSKEFFDLLKSDDYKRVFMRMGVDIFFDTDYWEHIDAIK